jgi:acyl-coenzyme A synthetase/AMP-(fatty) acid ligase
VNVVELFDQAVRASLDTAAFIDGPDGRERQMCYAALDAESRRIATLFVQAGVKAGDGLVLMLPMSAQLYTVIVAAWRVGLVPVFIDPAAREERFAHCLSQYPVRAFVGTPAGCLLRLGSRALRGIKLAFVAGAFFPGAQSLRAANSLEAYAESHPCTADTPAMLAFTSGSTGRPKGMMRSHGLLRAMHAVLANHIKPRAGEVVLATMPVFTLTYLACGATCLIPDVDLRHPGRAEPGRLARQLQRWGASSGVVSPALLERLADHCLAQGLTLDVLRRLFVGGAPVFSRLLDKLAGIAPQCDVMVLYGSTEAEPIALVSATTLTADDVAWMKEGRGLLAGKPIPEITLRILRDRWGSPREAMSRQALEQESLGTGQSGEIVVSGAHVAPGYLDTADERGIKFRVDDAIWHRTGDAGWLDEQGRLWLVGRCGERIDDVHGQLYPGTVEAALSFHPAVARSALLLYQHKRTLVIETRHGARLDNQTLLMQVGWAAIEVVVLVKQLPVDARHNAKVDYRNLRILLEGKRWLSRIETGS